MGSVLRGVIEKMQAPVVKARKVLSVGHPALRQPSTPLTIPEIKDKSMQTTIDQMVATMRDYTGCGLAAPQIGLNAQVRR